jgi:hypothetical protein
MTAVVVAVVDGEVVAAVVGTGTIVAGLVVVVTGRITE